MEAKDTVMNDEELEKYNHPWRIERGDDYFDSYNPKEVAEAQAEISFKAGQESGCYAEGWAGGIREVVEGAGLTDEARTKIQLKYIRGDTFYWGAACQALIEAQLQAILKLWEG